KQADGKRHGTPRSATSGVPTSHGGRLRSGTGERRARHGAGRGERLALFDRSAGRPAARGGRNFFALVEAPLAPADVAPAALGLERTVASELVEDLGGRGGRERTNGSRRGARGTER